VLVAFSRVCAGLVYYYPDQAIPLHAQGVRQTEENT
jgi:hypothetical protein